MLFLYKIRPSRPDSGLGFQVIVRETISCVPSSLGSGGSKVVERGEVAERGRGSIQEQVLHKKVQRFRGGARI